MNARALLLALVGSPVLLIGCGGDQGGETQPIPTVTASRAGGFGVTVEGGEWLVVAASDGRVLLDGLAPADATDPPRSGFAVRDTSTSYEMSYGAFKPTEHPKGQWRGATSLDASQPDAVTLRGDDGSVLARLAFRGPEAGHLAVDVTPGDGPERRFSWGFACDARDHFAGFGAQSLDVDHRGFTVPTFVSEQGVGKAQDDSYSGLWFLVGARHASQIPIPQVFGSRGFVLTAETSTRAIFALCSEHAAEARVEVDLPVTLHVFDGPTPAQALERASATFGRPRMPPRVAFAPWLDAIFGSAGVRDIAARARAAKIPASVIWTEDWRGGEWDGDAYRLKEEWDADAALYPDIPALTDELHAEGFLFHVYFNPFVYKDSKAWGETEPKGWLVKTKDGKDAVFPGAKLTDTGLIDLDNDDARRWVIGKMRGALALGADGWMNDFGEWLPTDAVTAAGSSFDRHNGYAVQWQQVAREAIDGAPGDASDRLFISRSGWFGTPAAADVIWAGDQRTDFEADDGMPTVLPIGIGCGFVGISTFAHDISGYQSATNPVATKELYFRWTELGAWSPVMRTHHGTNPTRYEAGADVQSWAFWIDAETTEHFRRYAALHMALVPYNEGLARVAADTGLPIWRSLVIGFPDDDKAWGIKDEVLFGDKVLLAPVMTAGATGRDVYLPKARWYPWAGGAALGAGSVAADAAVGEIPVFAAAGAVVPMYPDGVMTLAKGSAETPDATSVGDDREVRVFLGADGSFAEAGGLTYALEHLADAGGALTATYDGAPVTVEANADGFIARVVGPGTLEIAAGGKPIARAKATGGDSARRITWVVRR